MPFVQRVVEPKYLSRTSLWDADGNPRVFDDELDAVTNNTLSNALRQLASLVLVANDMFEDLNLQLRKITERSEKLKATIGKVEDKVAAYDPKKVAVPESDICSFALLKHHYAASHDLATNLFGASTRPNAVQALYEAAAKTPIHLMRQMDRWRRDGHRTSRFFLCTPVLGARRRKIRSKVDIDIETRMPAAVEELRRWTSSEAIGDITVTPDCPNRIPPSSVLTDGDLTDGTIVSDDEAIDHKLPSPEEQLQVVALKFPPEVVAVDISGRSFDRMSVQRRSLLHADAEDGATIRRRTRTRKPRSRRRNTLAGTDQKEIQDALVAGEEPSPEAPVVEPELQASGAASRSKSSDILRSSSKKESPDNKKSHFNSLKQWGKNRLKMINKYTESKPSPESAKFKDVQDENLYETVTVKRKRSTDRERKSLHERQPSCSSSSEKSGISISTTNNSSVPGTTQVKLRSSSEQSRMRRSGGNKDEPHSSSGNWSASSESGRASIGSEITTLPKSTTSAATSSNSLNIHPPGSVNSRRRYNVNTSTSGSATSEGTLTPDIIHDLHEDGETSSVYSCDTEGYYTSFHMDSGLKTLKEEDGPSTPLHSTTAFSNSSSNNTILTAENEYELFGKGSTSTTTSSAGTVCTTLRASESNRSLIIGPAVPERISSLYKHTNKEQSPESSLERDSSSDKTGTVKRSPLSNKATVVAVVHKQTHGDVSPDSGHNTSSSPIESINSPNGMRSGSEFEFSESSDMEGADRIERIRVKTTINSSRIPSMCAITPPISDDEFNFDGVFEKNSSEMKMNQLNKAQEMKMGAKNFSKPKLDLAGTGSEASTNKHVVVSSVNGTKKMQLINVNLESGYATIETIDSPKAEKEEIILNRNVRAPSPSGGTVIVKEEVSSKVSQSQPIFKATLLPLNNMFGKLKSNLTHFGSRRDSKSPNKVESPVDNSLFDSGDYVTIADVKNNNEKSPIYANDTVHRNLKAVLSGKIRETEYISLNELPCSETDGSQNSNTADSLERRRRQGARVMLNADGKVVYSSDSLPRRKGASTFEPGPFVKKVTSPSHSPLPVHRTAKNIRPVAGNQQKEEKAPIQATDASRPLSPQLGKVVIRASSGMTSSTSEIVRMPPSTIVTPTATPMSPKPNNARGAYVHMQETRGSLSPTREEERALSPSNRQKLGLAGDPQQVGTETIFDYRSPTMDTSVYNRDMARYYNFKGGPNTYNTLPVKKTQYILNELPERSVTPDITRGLIGKNYDNNGMYRNERFKYAGDVEDLEDHHPRQYSTRVGYIQLPPNLGIPVQVPNVCGTPGSRFKVPSTHQSTPIEAKQLPFENPSQPNNPNESLRISPIDPRNTGSFHSSTPAAKIQAQELKSAVNLENKLLSPKKSTMSNEELYAMIHKSKKKMNIRNEEIDRGSPILFVNTLSPVNSEGSLSKITPVKSPETGYIGDKSRARQSWSPKSGEYVDFNTNIDRIPPSPESRSRLSWACNDRKGTQQTSTLDFKKLLLQVNSKPNPVSSSSKKISAVERLKMSKEQIQPTPKPAEADMNILELSRSPRSIGNRKLANNNAPSSPRSTPEKVRAAPKLLSPRSQWRFANPRSDVLSSTIHEDCREDESPNSSAERKYRRHMSEMDVQTILQNPTRRDSSTTGDQGRVTNSNANGAAAEKENEEKVQNQNRKYVSVAERLQAQRAQFFNSGPHDKYFSSSSNKNDKPTLPTLETAF